VLIADQWVETGATMGGAIRLIERQAGVVADMAAIAIEDNAVTAGYRQRLICASAVVPGSRWQAECDAQALSSFARYEAHLAFPARRNG
jgi:adenine phosphoribosyltransferase